MEQEDALGVLLEYLSTLAIAGGDSTEQKIAAFDAIRELACTWQALRNERTTSTENNHTTRSE